MKTNHSLLGIPVLLFLLSGCTKQQSTPPMPTNAVAMVGTQFITRETLQSELVRRGRVSFGRSADPQERQAVLEELIRTEALNQKALAAGYDQDPQITASLRRMIVAKYQEDQLAKLGQPKVGADDIADYYQKNQERFGTPEKVRAAMIEIQVARTATPEKRAEAASRAATVLNEARTNATPDHTFGLLAQQYSSDQASRYRGGDMGWLTVGDTNTPWDPAVLAALFQLAQPGELAPVIQTPTAFYLVKLSARQPANVRPLEEVKDGVAYLVARQKEQAQQRAFYASVKQGLAIRINQPLLDAIYVPAPESKPPGVPGGSPVIQARNDAGK